ncbi:hypothetical protein JM664_08045 [Rhodobacteraceae bacterium MCCB 386]|nr:hypothetical protein [Roseitranquillus sediminis]
MERELAEIDDAWAVVQSKLKKFAEAIDEFRTIKVRTMISEFEVVTQKDSDGRERVTDVQLATGTNAKGLVTKIDMLQGDISHGRSPGLSPEDEAALSETHLEHVKLGQKIFTDNIRFVADTVERFARRRNAPEE